MRIVGVALVTFASSLIVFKILSDFGGEWFTHRNSLRKFCCLVFTHNDKEFTIAATLLAVGIELLREGK